jgi:hypothetical protein
MHIGALVEHTVFGVLWLIWKGGAVLGLSDDGRSYGPGTPMVMPDEFAPVVPAPPPASEVAAPAGPESTALAFVGHTRSKTLHRPSCRYAPPGDFARPFAERSVADAAGFRPCKICLQA